MTDPKKARCFDPSWRYYPEAESDIRRTFARIRRQLKEAEAVKNAQNVRSIKKERKA